MGLVDDIERAAFAESDVPASLVETAYSIVSAHHSFNHQHSIAQQGGDQGQGQGDGQGGRQSISGSKEEREMNMGTGWLQLDPEWEPALSDRYEFISLCRKLIRPAEQVSGMGVTLDDLTGVNADHLSGAAGAWLREADDWQLEFGARWVTMESIRRALAPSGVSAEMVEEALAQVEHECGWLDWRPTLQP